MKLSRPASFAIAVAALLLAHQAAALTQDDKSMNAANGAPRFADPDDQIPGAINLSGASPTAGGVVDPSAVRYDYDPQSGTYVPHKN
jgi:hypothetical protein